MTDDVQNLQTAITNLESANLADLEQAIGYGLSASLVAGYALAVVRDRRLWALDYPSFQAYVDARWTFKYRRACQLIRTADTAQYLLADDTLREAPMVDSWVAALHGLQADAAVATYRTALAEHNQRPTAADVAAVRRRLYPAKPKAVQGSSAELRATAAAMANKVRAHILLEKAEAAHAARVLESRIVLSQDRQPLYLSLHNATNATAHFNAASSAPDSADIPPDEMRLLREAAQCLVEQLNTFLR